MRVEERAAYITGQQTAPLWRLQAPPWPLRACGGRRRAERIIHKSTGCARDKSSRKVVVAWAAAARVAAARGSIRISTAMQFHT